jgi:O-antigen/teichoic acid export membrane protein
VEPVSAEKQAARQSALIYVPLSLGMALLFFLVAGLAGGYPPVARVGGAVWVWLLSMIVSMPLVTSRVKKHSRGKAHPETTAGADDGGG